uniref:Amine oxidase domain-containing protein n=1 Tax=Solanum lycopersicum TaxID=4081 RepID=A0A3Q7J3K7_SOLLC
MVSQKPKIVIIGAGIAGLTAAKKLYTTQNTNELFEVCVVEGGNRIGGRIFTTEFCGDRVEMGATWIHGIEGNPIYKIAQEINGFETDKPWDSMGGKVDKKLTITEEGHEVHSSFVNSISNFFNNLLEFSSGEGDFDGGVGRKIVESLNLEENGRVDKISMGSYLRKGLDTEKDGENVEVFENWSRKALEEGIFAMFENIHRHYSSAGDLGTLDFNGESEYCNFPGDEITIAKGYSSIVESLASVLPPGLIQLGRKVSKIEWQLETSDGNKPVKLHFSDGSVMYADHVIVTVSLGVLKQGIREDSSLFSPPLPKFKTEAISRLGFGVVDKVFLQLTPTHHDGMNFPNMMMVFHQSNAKLKNPKIPLWIRRTTLTHPVYPESRVVVSWFAGEEALKVETLDDDEIIEGVSITMSEFLSNTKHYKNSIKFSKVLKCKWGTDPLFLGSYTHIAVGSSGDDLDAMAEPLPKEISDDKNSKKSPRLQVLFAGEATSRNYYSTTHGAYLTGLREANRLLEYFQCVDV